MRRHDGTQRTLGGRQGSGTIASTLHVSRIRLLAVALLVPAVLFVTVNLLRYQVGVAQPYDTLSPLWSTGVGAYQLAFNATVLLGPVIAMTIAAVAVLRVRFARTNAGSNVAMTIRRRWPEIGVLAFGAALVGVMGIYLIAENLPCIRGRQLYC